MTDKKFFIANNLFFVPAQTNAVIRVLFVVDRVLGPRVRLAVGACNIGKQVHMKSKEQVQVEETVAYCNFDH